MLKHSRLLPAVLLVAPGLWAAAPDANLQDLLGRMDQAAASFQSMSGNVKYITHTAVLDDNSEESGSALMKKIPPGQVQARIDFAKPDRHTVTIAQRQVQNYLPKEKTIESYDLGKHGEQLDRFVMLGFGTSGTELARDYDVKLAGSSVLNGQKTTVLELVPKSGAARDLVDKMDLWIPDRPARPYPIQEKIFQKSGDYRLINYSDIKINSPIPADALQLKPPPGVKTVYPQK